MRPWCRAIVPCTWIAASVPVPGPWPGLSRDIALAHRMRAGARGQGKNVSADFPEMRASDADRDRVVDVLRDAAGDGRLTADEFEERMEAALSSRTLGELA